MVKDLLFPNTLVSEVKSYRNVLIFNKLDLSNLLFICYNDSSFGNFVSGVFQGGFVIYISDNTVPIIWSFHKLKHVVKSAMTVETLVQVNDAESTFWLRMLYQD